MKDIRTASLVAALALCASPLLCLAGEAPAASAPTATAPAPEDTEKKLAEAQQRLDAAVREVAELSGQMGRRFALRMGVEPGDGPPQRALLGVGIGALTGQSGGGAVVMNVSPGGAAAEAGIKEGDIITSIAGQDLTKESEPGRTLVEKMRQLEPNLKVQVAVLRDGRKMNFDVAPRPAPPIPAFALRRGPGAEWIGGPPPPSARMERNITVRRDDLGARFRGMEFASLSERLAGYFGVKSGVLVVRAGGNEAYKLQDGDVILAIDGREPTSAQHAGRILRSYQAGEKLTIKVQRDRKAQNIDVTVPGGRDED